MKKRMLSLLLIFSLLLLVAACGSSSEPSSSDSGSSTGTETSTENTDDYTPEISNIILASGPIGGGWYNTSAGLAEILMREIPGLNVTVIEGGGVPNLRDVSKGDAHLGYAFASDLYAGLNGMHAFEGEPPVEKVNGFLTLYTSLTQAVVLADSGINSYADLKDKRLLPGQRTWGVNLHMQTILDAYDISYEEMEADGNISYTGYSEMPILMQDGNADFMWGMSAAPSPFIMEINALQDIKFLETDPELQAIIEEKFPGVVPQVLPANTYDGQTEPIQTIGTQAIITINEDLPEELVYRMTKAVMENLDEFHGVDPVLADFNKDTMVDNLPEDRLHPGVVRYLNEVK